MIELLVIAFLLPLAAVGVIFLYYLIARDHRLAPDDVVDQGEEVMEDERRFGELSERPPDRRKE